MPLTETHRLHTWSGRGAATLLSLVALAGCGNTITPQPVQANGSTLCISDFERCVNPVFDAVINGRTGPATCAAAGCHAQSSGSGGAFKIYPKPAPGSTESMANFFSARAFADLNNPPASRLLQKPDADGIPHAGGDIFPNSSDVCRAAITAWISNRVDDENAPSCGSCTVPATASCGY